MYKNNALGESVIIIGVLTAVVPAPAASEHRTLTASARREVLMLNKLVHMYGVVSVNVVFVGALIYLLRVATVRAKPLLVHVILKPYIYSATHPSHPHRLF